MENYKDAIFISWIFLSIANNLLTCQKSILRTPHTYTLTGKKSYCLEDSVLTILLFIQISVISISKAGTKLKTKS